jgi:hypothetical protein
MGSVTGKKQPKAPSLPQLQQAQQVDQATPFGRTTFSTDPSGNRVATFTPSEEFQPLAPQLGRLASSNLDRGFGFQATIDRLNAGGANSQSLRANLPELGDPLALRENLGQFGEIDPSLLPALDTDFGRQSQQAQQATFQGAFNLLRPQFEQQQRRAEQRLADQGIPITGEAAIGDTGFLTALNRDQGQALNNLALGSVLAGNQRQNQLFGQAAQARGQLFGEQGTIANLLDRQRAQQFGENQGVFSAQAQNRAQRFDENKAIFDRVLAKQMSLAGLSNQNAQFARSLVQPNAIPIAGGSNAAQQNFQNQMLRQQNQNQALSGLGSTLGLGTALGLSGLGASSGMAAAGGIGASLLPFAFSDRRIKENIKKVDDTEVYPIYEFSYIGQKERYRGVMAQDVEKINPDAVTEIDGIKAVNYAMINIPFERVA